MLTCGRNFCCDPDVYVDPLLFHPERFLGPEPKLESKDFIFGHGRRSCPGAGFADSWVFLAIATILATLDVAKARDEDGNVVEPVEEYTTGVIRYVFGSQLKRVRKLNRFAQLSEAVCVLDQAAVCAGGITCSRMMHNCVYNA